MRVAVISDTHDNIWKLEAAMPYLESADAVIHCGDLCAPFIARLLGDGVGETPVHIVWGNNDGDPFLISKVSSAYPQIHLHGPLAELEFQGRRIAVNHYPAIAHGLALSGKYHVVCYGHDHEAHAERLQDCLLLNPGEVMGLNGRSSLAVLDLEDLEFEWYDL